MIKRPKTERPSPALRLQSDDYPAQWQGRVPIQGRILKRVVGLRLPGDPYLVLNPGGEVELWVNSHGAAAAWAVDLSPEMDSVHRLGLKPDEFEITGWIAILTVCSPNCCSGIKELSGHSWHCPVCDTHLTSLYLCDRCNQRMYPWPSQAEQHQKRVVAEIIVPGSPFQ